MDSMEYDADIESKMEEEDIYDDPYQNYCRLKATAAFLQNGGRITEDWIEEHKAHVTKYAEYFPRFSMVNLENEGEEFRKKATESETILNYLDDTIRKSGTLDLRMYLILNLHMIYLCEEMFSVDALTESMQEVTM